MGRRETGAADLSVVVPACNEQASIGRCLEALLADAQPGELEVVVVCNGCADDTAKIARAFGSPVAVVETPVGSKPHALNLGDQAVSAFPRVYVDADVELTTADLRALVDPLRRGEAEAAAPMAELASAEASRWARAHHRVWQRLPQIRGGLMGRGVYAMSQTGRLRFGPFPDLVADDLFVHSVFPPEQRMVVDTCTARVRAATTRRDLVRRKTRVFAGNDELAARQGGRPAGSGARSLARAVASEPALVWSVPAYLLVNAEAKRRARRKLTRHETRTWERDDASRR